MNKLILEPKRSKKLNRYEIADAISAYLTNGRYDAYKSERIRQLRKEQNKFTLKKRKKVEEVVNDFFFSVLTKERKKLNNGN